MTKLTMLAVLTMSLALPMQAQAQAPSAPAPKPAPSSPGDAPAPAGDKAEPEAPPQGPPPLSETLEGDAKSDYESAKLLYQDGDNAGANVKFKSAYDKSKDPRLLWNIAATEKNLRHYSRALKLVHQYLDEGGDKLTEQDRTEAQGLIKVMEPFTSKLVVTTSEPGAEVYVDDDLVGTSPVEPAVVDIGTRKVRVHKEGFEDFVREVPVGGAAEVPLEVKLTKIVHEGRLSVRTNQGATIAVDGKVVGSGSWSGILPSGGHQLRVTLEKMRPYQSDVYIQDKESRDLTVTLEKEPGKGLPAWAWIAGGVVVAGGLTTAGIFAFSGGEDTYEGPRGNLTGVGNAPGGVAELGRSFR